MTKVQCEDCLNSFPEEETEEIASTGTILCKSCYAERKKSFLGVDDPHPFP